MLLAAQPFQDHCRCGCQLCRRITITPSCLLFLRCAVLRCCCCCWSCLLLFLPAAVFLLDLDCFGPAGAGLAIAVVGRKIRGRRQCCANVLNNCRGRADIAKHIIWNGPRPHQGRLRATLRRRLLRCQTRSPSNEGAPWTSERSDACMCVCMCVIANQSRLPGSKQL